LHLKSGKSKQSNESHRNKISEITNILFQQFGQYFFPVDICLLLAFALSYFSGDNKTTRVK
jgi:hypothetical protein